MADQKTPAKKTSAPAKKAAPAKKTASKKSTSAPKSKFKAGDSLMVKVDPRANNGSDMAPATVLRVLNVVGEDRVNVKVHVDGDADMMLRNVPVLGKAPGKKDEDVPTVYALRA